MTLISIEVLIERLLSQANAWESSETHQRSTPGPGMILILIFAEALGLYGLIVGLVVASTAEGKGKGLCSPYAWFGVQAPWVLLVACACSQEHGAQPSRRMDILAYPGILVCCDSLLSCLGRALAWPEERLACVERGQVAKGLSAATSKEMKHNSDHVSMPGQSQPSARVKETALHLLFS